MRMTICWLVLVSLVTCVHCYRILGIFPLPRKNYFVVFEKLMHGLVDRGHEVDVVSHFPQKTQVSRYNDINLQTDMHQFEYNLSVSAVETYGLFETANFIFKKYGTDVCERILNHSSIIQLKHSNVKYDLIITEVFGSDCFLGFSYFFKVPTVGVVSDVMVPWANDRMGNPDNPSYIPNYLLPFDSKMFLWDRIINTFSGIAYKFGYQILSLMPSELRAREFFGPDMTPLDVLTYNTSLLLVNSHFSSNFPRPTVPAVVEVAGLHVGSPKLLSENLTEFVKSSEVIIYVAIETKLFRKKQIDQIIKSLSHTKHSVVWKVNTKENEYLTTKANIYMNDTEFENLDMLCHPNTGVFITNGDLLVIQEAIHCGVPIIGIPLVAEHEIHVKNHVMRGLGVQIKFEDISQDTLTQAIKTVLYNTTYKRNANFQSTIFRDRPVKPLDNALYWIEYVIRYGGARHLRTVGADLNWLEYYLIDVTVACIGFIALIILFYVVLVEIVQKYREKKQIQTKIKEH